jgi:hypothetical protein
MVTKPEREALAARSGRGSRSLRFAVEITKELALLRCPIKVFPRRR